MEAPQQPTETEGKAAKLEQVHYRAIRRVDDVIKSQQVVRASALQARRFVSIPGAQWEGPWGEQFENSLRVEINKTARGHKKIILDYLANRIIPTFRNVGSDADEHTANTIAGLHRADSYHFKTQQARDNAFREASAGGFGAYRLTTAYADPYDRDSDDQRINPAMVIVDADQRVFFDPNSVLYDKSDARWGAVLIAMSPEAFAEDYPDASPQSMPDAVWKTHYEWFHPKQIVIAEYYERQEVKETLWTFTHSITGEVQKWWNSEISKEDQDDLIASGFEQVGRRRTRVRVRKYIMSGAEILSDEGFIAGCEIPIVPVYGNWEYIDGMERFTGHVQMAMDPARAYNAQITKLVETAALSPIEKPIFDPEQMPPNLQDLWARGHIDRHPYALAKALRNENGEIVQAGPIGKVEPPQLPPVIAGLVQIMASDIAELTNADDGADEVKANTSAEAMDIAATRIDAKSGIYIDNMRQSVQREGEIYLSMARDVYARKGRVVETMGDDGSDGEETLQEGFVAPNGAYQIRNDLSKGKYKVIADVTEATSTLRDRTVRRMQATAQVAVQAQDMELAQACLATAIANMDGEGITELKDWNRKRMLQIGLATPSEDEKREMAQAAQEKAQQPPDPAAQAMEAQAAALEADAQLKQQQAVKAAADTEAAKAKTVLTLAQAHALGGPVEAPDVPSGLDQAEQAANIRKTEAETRQIHHNIDNPPQQ